VSDHLPVSTVARRADLERVTRLAQTADIDAFRRSVPNARSHHSAEIMPFANVWSVRGHEPDGCGEIARPLIDVKTTGARRGGLVRGVVRICSIGHVFRRRWRSTKCTIGFLTLSTMLLAQGCASIPQPQTQPALRDYVTQALAAWDECRHSASSQLSPLATARCVERSDERLDSKYQYAAHEVRHQHGTLMYAWLFRDELRNSMRSLEDSGCGSSEQCNMYWESQSERLHAYAAKFQ